MEAPESKLAFPLIALSFLVAYLLLRFLHKQWFAPIRYQRKMKAQGIRGRPYRFLYGSTKEIKEMTTEAMSQPMEISHEIYPRIMPHTYAWSKIYGKNYLQWYGTQPQMTMADLEMVKEIMNDRDGLYTKPPIMSLTRDLFGDGLVTTIEPKKWSKLRKVADHAFNGESLNNMLPEMVVSTETMLRKWGDYEGQEVDVFDEFRLLTSDVISRTAFGSSYAEGKKTFEMLAKLITIVFSYSLFKIKIPVISRLVRDENEKEIYELLKGIRSSMIKLIHDREAKFRKGHAEGYGKDFLGVLVRAYKDPDQSKKMSLEEVIDECRTFYIAGQETTNTTLAWAMFLLAIHQNWQEEARREVLSVCGNENPNYNSISKLKIVGMILNETLRLYPAISGQFRNTSKDVKLGSLIIPANTNISIPALAIHHDPEIWGKDAHLFKPERFAEGIAKATNNNMAAFIPFGLGPRICAGINFSMLEAKIALSMILQRYKFTLSDSYVHFPVTVMTIRPQYGVKVILHSV